MIVSNKVVVRFRNGMVLKGYAYDFQLCRAHFNLWPENGLRERARTIPLEEIKLLCFVKTFSGNPGHRKQYAVGRKSGSLMKLRVRFRDGENMLGTTESYHPDRSGFMMVPADSEGNNLRVYVVSQAVSQCEREF